MSREEAIKYLNEFIIFKKISNITEEEAVECFKLAVEALQKQPCELLILKANFSLRQAELKEWSERIKRANEEGLIILPSYFEPILVPNDVEIRIEQEPKTEGARGDIPLQQTIPKMPQPSERTEERTETHECDCISRQLMYDMGATCIAARNKDGDLVALGALDILPSVTPQPKEEPQQKTGHWIEHKHGAIEHIECSKCGIWFLKADLIRKSYCPNCGSCNGDMIKNIIRDITKTMSGGTK